MYPPSIYTRSMIPLQQFVTGVVAEVIRRQPSSQARTTFAWEVSVGAAIARVTTAELVDGVLVVRARDPRWTVEVKRAEDTILKRMQHLLGPASVTRIVLAAD
jgi:predicted nucleic acid-binding Zn ribbon protein